MVYLASIVSNMLSDMVFRIFLCFFMITMVWSCNEDPSKNLPLHNKTVLILGNSITQNGTYVDFLEYFLRKNYPNHLLNITSIGLSSETVSGDSEPDHPFPRPCIHSRLDDALKLVKPDLVLACYGMNDGVFSEKDPARFENYKKGIERLKAKVYTAGADLILLTPTPFDPDPIRTRVAFDGQPQSYQHPYYNYGQVLFDYAQWLETINDVKVINLNDYLNAQLVAIKRQKADSTFIPDGVHPNTNGHFYMAKKILFELYPEIVLKDIDHELIQIKKDSFFALVSKRRRTQSKGWLDYVGYTRDKTVKSHSISQTTENVKDLDLAISKFLKDSD